MPDFAYPLIAIRNDGATITAYTPEEASAFNRLRPGRHHVERIHYIAVMGRDGPVWRESTVRHEWIIRDDHGRIVLHEDLPSTDAPRGGWRRRRLVEAQEAAERGLPIPRTGRRHRYSSGYRAFRTNIAMRAAEAALDQDLADWDIATAKVGRRRAHDLPQVRDDVEWRSGRRCWKDYRGTQWR